MLLLVSDTHGMEIACAVRVVTVRVAIATREAGARSDIMIGQRFRRGGGRLQALGLQFRSSDTAFVNTISFLSIRTLSVFPISISDCDSSPSNPTDTGRLAAGLTWGGGGGEGVYTES